MRSDWPVRILFSTGVALLFVHTTLPALWELFGPRTAYPLSSTEGPLSILSGFTPPLGAFVLLLAGSVHTRWRESLRESA